jgi:hypothetical protein
MCCPSDSTVLEDTGIEPRAAATLALSVRCTYQSDTVDLIHCCKYISKSKRDRSKYFFIKNIKFMGLYLYLVALPKNEKIRELFLYLTAPVGGLVLSDPDVGAL